MDNIVSNSVRKKILYISPASNPFDVRYGGAQRSNLLLHACIEVGDVDVVCFEEVREFDAKGFRMVYNRSIPQVQPFSSRKNKFIKLFKAWKIENHWDVNLQREQVIDNLVREHHYDYIITRYVNEAICMGLYKYADRLVVDIDDDPVEKAWNAMKQSKTMRNSIYMFFYTIMTKIALRRFLGKIAVPFFSNFQQSVQYNSNYLPNIPFYGIDPKQITNQTAKRGRLLFVGDLTYNPNYTGLDRFLTNVYPRLNGSVNMHVVGRMQDENLKCKWESIPGVSVLGFVEDLVKEYSEAEMVVIPIYYGAGTCIKVLEAMQMHRLLITTPMGARGYGSFAQPGVDYLLACDDDEFVAHIEKVIGNLELQQSITTHASNVVEQCFSREAFNKAFCNALK